MKIKAYLSSVLIAIFIIMAVSLNSENQKIPLRVKNNFFYTQKQNLKDTLSRRTGIDYPFIIGYNYIPVTNNESNHPYFKKNNWERGSLVYQDRLYTVGGLKYDIEIDKLIYIMYDKDNKMNCVALDENFISEFKLLNSTFRYYNDLKNNSGRKLKAGYYEVVYDGKLKFLVRSEKSETMYDFNTSTDLFLLKDGVMISVRRMGNLVRQLKDKEKAVKKYIRANSLRLNRSDYSSAFKVLKFYENL
ncbi:MAG: hypothetical protein JJE17_00680 [Peptostreptococcaceae bacterium]|nr:hypothetical protein [Peptostreptococcaceae bacterium]